MDDDIVNKKQQLFKTRINSWSFALRVNVPLLEPKISEVVVVEVLDFGDVCICRWIPTFLSNMLSPSSGAEVTRQGSRRLI
jgi:hypothetical protein